MDENFVFLLYGGMGSGKTTLVREFANLLEVGEKVTSPTFIGLNEYRVAERDTEIYHFDLYQVPVTFETLHDLLMKKTKRKIFIFEWSEKLDPALYEFLKTRAKIFKVNFVVNEDESRSLEIS